MVDDPAPSPDTPEVPPSLWQRLNRWKIIIVQIFSSIFGGLLFFANDILDAIKSAGIDWTLFFTPKRAALVILGLSILTVLLKLFASDASPLKKDGN